MTRGGREPYRLPEDPHGRVVLVADRRPTLVGLIAVGLLAAVALTFSLRPYRGGPEPRVMGTAAAILAGAAAVLAFHLVGLAKKRIVFDASRGDVTLSAAGLPDRVVRFADVQGIRLVIVGRGFQWRVQLETSAGESIELLTTGRIEIGKTVAAGLCSRFGFAPLADAAPEA